MALLPWGSSGNTLTPVDRAIGAGDDISRSLSRWRARGRPIPFGMNEPQFREYVRRLRGRPGQQNAILAEMGLTGTGTAPLGAGTGQPPPPAGPVVAGGLWPSPMGLGMGGQDGQSINPWETTVTSEPPPTPPPTIPPTITINTPPEYQGQFGSQIGLLAGLPPGFRSGEASQTDQPPPAGGVPDVLGSRGNAYNPFRLPPLPEFTPPAGQPPPTGLLDALTDERRLPPLDTTTEGITPGREEITTERILGTPPPMAPGQAREIALRGVQGAAGNTEAPGPGFLDRLRSGLMDPLTQMGLGVLLSAPGQGAQGLRIGHEAEKARRERAEYERLTNRRSVMDRVWAEAFPNGQPNTQHPLLRDVPPEMLGTIFALGPDVGLPELQRYAFARSQQDLQLRLRQRQLDLLEGRVPGGPGGPGGQPPPTALGTITDIRPPPDPFGGAGVADAERFGLPSGPPPPAVGAQPPPGGPAPTVRWMGRDLPLNEAVDLAERANVLGIDTTTLRESIRDARRSAQPTETMRNRASQVDAAYRTLVPLLDDYVRLVNRTGATFLPGQESDAVRQARNQILLQLKELNNLGVLNGPDLALMETMLVDPGVGVGWTGPYGGPNLFGNAGSRVQASADRLRELLRVIRNGAVAPAGIAPIERSTGGGGGRGADDPWGIR